VEDLVYRAVINISLPFEVYAPDVRVLQLEHPDVMTSGASDPVRRCIDDWLRDVVLVPCYSCDRRTVFFTLHGELNH